MTRVARSIVLVFVFAGLALGLASAAGRTEAVQAGIPTLRLDVNYFGDPKNTDDEVWNIIRDRIGIEAEFIHIPWAERTQILLRLIAAGDPPDVFRTRGPGFPEYEQWRSEGVFLDLTDIAREYPAINERLSDPQYRNYAKDGRWYSIPGYFSGTIPSALQIRKDWLDILGLNMPTNVDEFYDVLVAFRDKNPGAVSRVVPFSVNGVGPAMEGALQILFTGSRDWEKVGDSYQAIYVLDSYKDYLKYMNRLYTERLLDPDFFIDQHNIVQERMAGGRLGAMFHNIDRHHYVVTMEGLLQNAPGAELAVVAPPLAGPAGRYHLSRPDVNLFVVMPADAKNNVKSLELLDFLMSDEGAQLVMYGVEGTHYNVINGEIIQKEEAYKADAEALGFNPWALGAHILDTVVDFKYTIRSPSFLPHSNIFNEAMEVLGDYRLMTVAHGFSSDEFTVIGPEIRDIRMEYTLDFITGRLDIDRNWGTYLRALNDAGYATIQRQVTEFIESSR